MWLYENVPDYYFKCSLAFSLALLGAKCLQNVQTNTDWTSLCVWERGEVVIFYEWKHMLSWQLLLYMYIFKKKKKSACLICHTIAERNDLILCLESFWPPHRMFPPLPTHHIIFSCNQCMSHGKLISLFHICSDIFQPHIMLEILQK